MKTLLFLVCLSVQVTHAGHLPSHLYYCSSRGLDDDQSFIVVGGGAVNQMEAAEGALWWCQKRSNPKNCTVDHCWKEPTKPGG